MSLGASAGKTGPRVATIGVYGYAADSFLGALKGAVVRQLLDVRQRRGVRGPDYSWANAVQLQALLVEVGIGYCHRRELAPTNVLRHIQYAEDARLGVGKRSRVQLASAYRTRYLQEILDHVDLAPIVDAMPADGVTALLCVERDPEACHRSLVAERMAREFDASVFHLRP